MVSEDRTVRKILDLMLDGHAAFQLMPDELYVPRGQHASFLVVMLRAQKLGHVVIGYQHREMLNLTSVIFRRQRIVTGLPAVGGSKPEGP